MSYETEERGDPESTVEIVSTPVRTRIRMRRRRSKGRVVLLAVILAVVLFVGILYGYYRSQVDGGSSSKSVTVAAMPGEGLSQFAVSLASKHVIGSSLVFKVWLHTQPTVILRAGTYKFKEDSAYSKVIATLEKGPILDKLIVPDGLTLDQIAQRVGKLPGHTATHFLQVANSGKVRSPFEPRSVNSLEGLLYPDTYVFGPSTSDSKILQMMSDAFVTEAHKLGLTPSSRVDNLSAYQTIVLASIVEKEAKYPGDANKVARVILNRLSNHMKLQMDSTVLYALGNPSDSQITKSDLSNPSPYNTYENYGLPPTPIATPSETALQAAMNPAKGNWLYFVVVQKNGQEAFSTTYSEQLQEEKLAKSRGLG